jgi:hypothetical protein
MEKVRERGKERARDRRRFGQDRAPCFSMELSSKREYIKPSGSFTQ